MSNTASSRVAAVALAILALLALIWGYNWVVMKKVMAYADPFDFSALRTLLGALTLFAVLIVTRRSLRPVMPRATLLLGLLQTAAFTGLVQWALVHGGAGKTAVLVYVMPFWLLPLAWMFLGERVRGGQWLAIALAAVGLVGILAPWRVQGSWLSNLLALVAGLAWACSALVAKYIRRNPAVDLLSMTAWQMLMGALVLCALAGWLPSRPLEFTPYFVFALVYNAVLATGLAWLMWLFILDRLPAGLAGLSSLAVPAVGVLAAWLELGERPGETELAGMCCIALALGLMSWLTLRRRLPKAE